jgi:predicted helicase
MEKFATLVTAETIVVRSAGPVGYTMVKRRFVAKLEATQITFLAQSIAALNTIQAFQTISASCLVIVPTQDLLSLWRSATYDHQTVEHYMYLRLRENSE